MHATRVMGGKALQCMSFTHVQRAPLHALSAVTAHKARDSSCLAPYGARFRLRGYDEPKVWRCGMLCVGWWGEHKLAVESVCVGVFPPGSGPELYFP